MLSGLAAMKNKTKIILFVASLVYSFSCFLNESCRSADYTLLSKYCNNEIFN